MEIDLGTAYMKKDNRIKVTVNTFRGQTYVHIREYMVDLDNERWVPTPKGYAILAEELDEVISLLSKASEAITKQTYKPVSDQLSFDF